MGTSGNIRNDPIGNDPVIAFDDEISHAVEHRLAIVKALKSFCVSISLHCDCIVT